MTKCVFRNQVDEYAPSHKEVRFGPEANVSSLMLGGTNPSRISFFGDYNFKSTNNK